MSAPQRQWFDNPELCGERVRLVPLGADHAAGLLAAADDDEVFAWSTSARPRDLDEAQAYVAACLARGADAPWVQVDVASGEVAGLTTYYDIAPHTRSLAIGYTWLGRRFWRTGLNTEAKLLLLRRAFDDLGAVRVVWHADSRNVRSQEAVLRLGAAREGVLRKHKQRRDGSWRDTALLAMTDDEWPAAHEALTARLARG